MYLLWILENVGSQMVINGFDGDPGPGHDFLYCHGQQLMGLHVLHFGVANLKWGANTIDKHQVVLICNI